jgi:hypothetical protein
MSSILIGYLVGIHASVAPLDRPVFLYLGTTDSLSYNRSRCTCESHERHNRPLKVEQSE